MINLENFLEKYPPSENCKIRRTLSFLGDKWSILSLLIIHEKGVLRFNELHKIMDGISQKVLTTTLKNLENEELIIKKSYPVIPPKVEYSLSEKGKTLMPIIEHIFEWIEQTSE